MLHLAIPFVRHYKLLATLFVSASIMSCGGDPANGRPVPQAVMLVVDEDTPVALSLTATDPESDTITFRIATLPAHGTLVLDELTGNAHYTPAPDFAGTVTFTFTANDKHGPSIPAPVTIEFLPVNDAPRIPEIPELYNLADQPVTIWTLNIADPDSTQIDVEVLSAEPEIAHVTYDIQRDAIEIRAETYGETTITVRASDGLLDAERTFNFRATRVTREVKIAIPDPSSSMLVIRNPLDIPLEFGLGWNNKTIYKSARDLVESAIGELRSDADVALALWRFISSKTYHHLSFANKRWEHDPLLLVNSIGFGLCDDTASALAFMARQAGLPARVWALEGHVVPELQVNDAWQIFDADLRVYYQNENARLVGVEELATNASLITSPIDPLYPELLGGYSQYYADIYSTLDDNRIEPWYDSGAPSVRGAFTLPPGAHLQFPGTWVDTIFDYLGGPVPAYTTMRMSVPYTTRQKIHMPLVLLAVRGEGTVRIAAQNYLIGGADLEGLLRDNGAFVSDVEILDATTDVELIMLLNTIDAGLTESTTARMTGLKVWGLEIDAEHTDFSIAYLQPELPSFPF